MPIKMAKILDVRWIIILTILTSLALSEEENTTESDKNENNTIPYSNSSIIRNPLADSDQISDQKLPQDSQQRDEEGLLSDNNNSVEVPEGETDENFKAQFKQDLIDNGFLSVIVISIGPNFFFCIL